MIENKFIGVGDIHFKSSYFNRLDNVKDTFKDKMVQIYKLAAKHEVEGIILTGDVFDSKDPYQCPPGFLTWVMSVLRMSPVTIYTIVGNHDIRNNDLDTIPRQPIGTIFESGFVTRLTNFDNIVGHDFGTDLEKVPGGRFDLAVIHAYVNKAGGTMFGNEKVWAFAELELLNAKIVLAGHDHQAYPIEKSGGTLIVRPGALFRKNRDEVDLNRTVQVVLMDLTAGTAEYLPIEHRPSKEVFSLEIKDLEDKNEADIEQFIKSLSVSSVIKKVSLEDEMRKLIIDPKVKDVITRCLDRAKGGDE